MRRAIGATGFHWKELVGSIPPNPEFVQLVINGIVVAHGEVLDVSFVDGGFLVLCKTPPPPPEMP